MPKVRSWRRFSCAAARQMTESDWLNSTDTGRMLGILRGSGTASGRKLRLFAVACCRRVWHLLADERSRRVVEVAERYADGATGEVELRSASLAALHVDEEPATWAAIGAAAEGEPFHCADTAAGAASWVLGPERRAAEQQAQAALVRDVFGLLPFRSPPPLAPSLLAWQSGLVRRLAEAAYEERSLPSGHLDNARLAVLADALEEAGCTDAELLGHLRGPGPHVRGCWAVDLLTGRE